MKSDTIADLVVRRTGAETPGGLDVILLHGFGAPGDDLVPLGKEIDAPPGTRFFFPEAPMLLPPELGGGVGRAWWMIDVARIQMAMMMGKLEDMTNQEPDGLAGARARIEALVVELVEHHGVQRERLILGGFSQGAMLACDVALRSEEPLAGLVLMSGTLLAAERWQSLMPKRQGLEVVQSHGRSDALLPFSIADQLRDAMTKNGLLVDFVPFHGGHGIAPQVIERVSALLARVSPMA